MNLRDLRPQAKSSVTRKAVCSLAAKEGALKIVLSAAAYTCTPATQAEVK